MSHFIQSQERWISAAFDALQDELRQQDWNSPSSSVTFSDQRRPQVWNSPSSSVTFSDQRRPQVWNSPSSPAAFSGQRHPQVWSSPPSSVTFSDQRHAQVGNSPTVPSSMAFQLPMNNAQFTAAVKPSTPAAAQSWRVISPPMVPLSEVTSSPSKMTKPASVKHLTCFFWAKNGVCKFNEAECLYAHHNTGKIANGPLQVEPGRPAVAGKNATAARPVYLNWRAGQNASPPPATSFHGGMVVEQIQEQIRYITNKARAASPSQDLASSNTLLHARRQSVTVPSAYTVSEQGIQQQRSTSSTSSDSNNEQQMLILKNVTKHLFAVTQRNLNIVDTAATSLHANIETLWGVYQAIIPAHAHGLDPLHMEKMYKALRSIAGVVVNLEDMGDMTSETTPAVAKTLEDVDLQELVHDWNGSDN